MNTLALLVEFLGTFVFLFTILTTGGNAWWTGGMLILLMLMTQHISGAYFNPATSFVAYFRDAVSLQTFLAYIILQFLAAIAAFLTFKTFSD